MAHPQTDTHAREQTRRDEQAHKNADAARAGVEKLADFRQRATADAWKSMQEGVDAATQRFRMPRISSRARWASPGRRANGSPGSPGRTWKPSQKFGTVLTQACQDTSREWYGLAQQLQRNLEGLSKLAHCRSVQDFAATQSGLVRESLQHMVEDSRLIVEISLKAVNDASKAVAGTAQEKGRAGALAA